MYQPIVTEEMIEEWRSDVMPMFPTKEGLPYAFNCATPIDAVSALGIRSILSRICPQLVRIACDAFVMAYGECPCTHWTRFGGVPHRPRDQSWPMSPAGNPMTYVGQFCLADSRDLLGSLPGDVLLIFMDGDYLSPGELTSLSFEWQPLEIPELADSTSCCGTFWSQFEGYGMRLRTYDYVDIDEIEKQVVPMGKQAANIEHVDRYWTVFARQCARVPGPKIGGLPLWYNEVPETVLSGGEQFLLSFASFGGAMETSWPWANRKTPLVSAECCSERHGMDFFDGFVVNIFLSEDNEVKWYWDLP